LLCASQDQPGRPAGRQGLGDRLRHHRQALAPALAAGWDALGLADAADIGRDAAIASRVPVRSDLLKELDEVRMVWKEGVLPERSERFSASGVMPCSG
jgi:hypothetical protein